MHDPRRVAILISGRGSNMRALVERAHGYDVTLIVSNKPGALGLQWARERGLATWALESKGLGKEDYDRQLSATLEEHGIGTIALAGFMRLLDTGFVEAWRDRMINIHPSLLPAFPGLHPQRQALAAGARFSGCTVHFVRPETDSGPIIAQAVVPVHDDDDEERLARRILAEEYRLYPLALRLYAEGRLRIDGNRVTVAGGKPPEIAALNPAL